MVSGILGVIMFFSVLLFVLGFVLLIKSANWLIDGASSLAHKFSISDMAIGLSVVAFGTSAPELIVNILSSVRGHDDMCFGNVIGSNIFNILVVLGITGIVTPLTMKLATVKKEIPFVMITSLLVFGMVNNFGFSGSLLSRLDGLILITIFVLFMIYIFGMSKERVLEGIEIKDYSGIKSLWLIMIGMFGLFLGGNMVVGNAVNIATILNTSEKFVALTMVALGTSLPELVTSMVAITKKRADLAIGNVVGSNLFNLLLVLGVTSVVKPIFYSSAINIDFIFMIFISALLFLFMFTGKKRKLDRAEAILFTLLYMIYLFFLIYRR